MFCAYTRPRNQVSVYRAIGPLCFSKLKKKIIISHLKFFNFNGHKLIEYS